VEGAAARAADALGVDAETVRDSPYVLIGPPEQVAARLRDHHERFGITRWTVFGNRTDLQRADAFVPVLERLGG
jgi:hypothetical protein